MNKYNLTDILSKELTIEEQDTLRIYKFEGVQIPMIQRDYAQGRVDEVEIRNRFLKSIFKALVNDENLELDFVYGSIKELDKKTYFIPLDGQQRITTLFLLHWYIGNRELQDIELEKLLVILKGFTYATRSSARDFCEKLTLGLKVEGVEEFKKISPSFKVFPSKEITNAAWFYDRFKKDPTIKAMLTMLDAIHFHYEEELVKNSELKLFPSVSKLSFYILPLGGFNLSDELYIKMNARGKQLTDFENFKADLINWIRNEKNPNSIEFYFEVKLKDRVMPYHLIFATKLDNSWTNLFWDYTNKYSKINSKEIDVYYLRFWNRFLLNNFIITSSELPDVIEKSMIFKKLYSNAESEDNFKYEGFEFYQQLFEKQNVILNAQKNLDELSENFIEILKCLQPFWAVKDNWNLFDEKINQRQRILFLAISLYLQKNNFNLDKFKNWIRVVWNIIIDPDIRSISVMINIMRIVEKLSIGSGDIYKFLIGPDLSAIILNETSFVKAQLEEEKLKAVLINSNPAWEPEIILAEKHQLFQGNINFLLLNEPDIKTFKDRLSISEKLFSTKGTTGLFADGHLLIRAVISNIEDWDALYAFNFGDNFDNWQLLLRRNLNVQAFICRLCDINNEKAIVSDLFKMVLSESIINAWSTAQSAIDKSKHIHHQLYHNSNFHEWLQSNEVIKLKWTNDQVYIRKPSAWFKWVALDSYRNEITTELINKFSLGTTQQCGNSNFYYGFHTKNILLTGTFNKYIISAQFDEYGNFKIGVKDDGKSILHNTVIIPPNDLEDGWLVRKEYTYLNILNNTQVNSLINQISDEIFDENKKGSVLNTII